MIGKKIIKLKQCNKLQNVLLYLLGMNDRVVLELVERGYRQPQPSKCPDNIYKIMLSCWHTSPNNRPTFDYLFDFFDNYCESAEPEVGKI